MTGIDRNSESDAFLANKKATWESFTHLTIGASVAVIVILVVLALIFVV